VIFVCRTDCITMCDYLFPMILLPELKLLSIRACPSVTPEGLFSVLVLPFLQHFEYYTRRPVPKSFVWRIASQNPSLETIRILTTDKSDVPPNPWWSNEKKDLFKQHPRIKALNLVKTMLRHFPFFYSLTLT